MKTCVLRLIPSVLVLFSGVPSPISAIESNESNLTLLDTVNPAIKDLAKDAGDLATYESLKERNKIGVFFSEGLTEEVLTPNSNIANYFFNLLSPWNEHGRWTVSDFLHDSSGPLFFMNDARYQPLPDNGALQWNEASTLKNRLLFTGNTVTRSVFTSSLNTQNSNRVQLYKRFEFPTGLNYAQPESTGYELDRSTISSSAKKFVIVVHGWNPSPDTDPYASDKWPVLLRSLSGQISAKKTFAPNWDLYAYRWGRDSYTGGLGSMLGYSDAGTHAKGGIGVGQENGTQAAEIGYQHGLVLGKLIRDHCMGNNIGLEKIHFIAHSAGTWVARSASLYLNATQSGAPLQQQITLLDPYMPHEGYVGWVNWDPPLAGGETSSLGRTDIDSWASEIVPGRCENIYSVDTLTFGTNEVFWKNIAQQSGQTFANRQVGKSFTGKELDTFSCDGHGGPINYFSYTADPGLFVMALNGVRPPEMQVSEADLQRWRNPKFGNSDSAGWEYSLFMTEYKAASKPFPLAAVAASGYSIQKTISQSLPSRSPRSPTSRWKQILVYVDENEWVRAMLVPEVGGAAALAGPVRMEPDGTFSVGIADGTVLAGSFDASVSPVAISLTVDGDPFGQKVVKAQGAIAQAGIDANVNAAGNGVFSMVLADGTTGMSVARDVANTGWQGSGIGVVDSSGSFTVTGANDLQVIGELQLDGTLDPQATMIAPPQVPEIYITDSVGTSLVSSVSSVNCGNVPFRSTSNAVYLTVKNTGTIAMTDLAVMVDGLNAEDFSVSQFEATSLNPESSITLNVTFTPQMLGSGIARLRIVSNDADESSFDIVLKGNCFSATEIDPGIGSFPGQISAGGGGDEYFHVLVSSPGILIAWTEGSTDTYGFISSTGGVVLDEDNDSDMGANFRVSAPVTPGDYFVNVSGSDAAAAGAYTLHTRFIPYDAPFEITFLDRASDDVNIGFPSVAAKAYSIQGSDDMIEWSEVSTATGDGAEKLVTLPWHGAFQKRFFRISTQNP